MSDSNFVLQSNRLIWIIPHTLNSTLYATARIEPAKVLSQLGWNVTLVAAEAEEPTTISGLQIRTLPLPAIYMLGQILFHLRVLLFLFTNLAKFDVIMFQQTSGVWLLPLGLLRLIPQTRRPLLLMDTRDLEDITEGDWKARLRLRFYYLGYSTIGRWVDGQTTITTRMAQMLDIPADMLWGIWPSGAVIERFQSARAARELPKPDGPLCLMYIGTVLQKRNLHQLCHAVMRANAAGMVFNFIIVGDGEMQQELAAIAADSAGAIHVLPPIPHEQVSQMLTQAHIGVTSLPAIYDAKYEASSPIKLFEYMAAGLPVLATRNACHTEVIQNGQYAFWVEEATEDQMVETLTQLWAQRGQLAELGREAADASHLWSWQAAGQKLANALQSGLLKHRGKHKQRVSMMQ